MYHMLYNNLIVSDGGSVDTCMTFQRVRLILMYTYICIYNVSSSATLVTRGLTHSLAPRPWALHIIQKYKFGFCSYSQILARCCLDSNAHHR